jgi:hypothetical protein
MMMGHRGTCPLHPLYSLLAFVLKAFLVNQSCYLSKLNTVLVDSTKLLILVHFSIFCIDDIVIWF